MTRTLKHPILAYDEIARYLRIAKRYASYVKKAKNVHFPGIVTDHATIVDVFSAAAVEAALNLYIALPLLMIKQSTPRAFFGSLITNHARVSVPQKIKFAQSMAPSLKSDPNLCKEIFALFKSRNSFLHSSPAYTETTGIDFSKLRGLNFDRLKKRPVLQSRIISIEDTLHSFQNYENAVRFISVLDKDISTRLNATK